MPKFEPKTIDKIEHTVTRTVHPIVLGISGVLLFIVEFNFTEYNRDSELIELWGFFDKRFWLWMLAATATVSFLLSLFVRQHSPTRRTLVEELKLAQTTNSRIGENILLLMDGLLLNLSRKLGFSNDGHSRVSLYIHDESKRCFIPCGRFSHDPVYREKGRAKYPINQGCIGEAWRNDWCFDADIPEQKEAATSFHKDKYGISKKEEIVERMHSRMIAAKKILDNNSSPIGVIVVESVKRDAFDEADLRRTLTEVADDYGRIVRGLHPYIPDPGSAQEFGL